MLKNQTGFPKRQKSTGYARRENQYEITLYVKKRIGKPKMKNKQGFPIVTAKHNPKSEIQNRIPNVKDLSIWFEKRITIR